MLTPSITSISNAKVRAGKAEWQDITMTLYDPVVPSAGKQQWNGFVFHMNQLQVEMDTQISTRRISFFQYAGPVGDKVEE